MKRILSLIAIMAICSAVMVSCKNTKTAEPTPEEIQAQKVALADSVLADIDAFVDEYINASENAFYLKRISLTDEEKMVKPDYLLDPSVANTLVTKSQKVNALAIYILELGIRDIYDMPLDDTKETIAKLALELNHPVEIDMYDPDVPRLERIRKEYDKCKENGDLAYFWQFQNAAMNATSYILSQNPELFFSKITEEQWQAFCDRRDSRLKAIEELAQYDEEMAQVWEFRNKYRVTASDEERDRKDKSIEAAKQYYSANKDKYATKRNALLQ